MLPCECGYGEVLDIFQPGDGLDIILIEEGKPLTKLNLKDHWKDESVSDWLPSRLFATFLSKLSLVLKRPTPFV